MSDQINRADIMALPKLSLTLGKMGRIELHYHKPLKGVSQWINVKDVDGLRYADQPTLADAQIERLVEAAEQKGREEGIIKGMHIALTTPVEQVPDRIAAALAAVKGGAA